MFILRLFNSYRSDAQTGQYNQKCGKGWVGIKGNCKRSKKAFSEAERKAQLLQSIKEKAKNDKTKKLAQRKEKIQHKKQRREKSGNEKLVGTAPSNNEAGTIATRIAAELGLNPAKVERSLKKKVQAKIDLAKKRNPEIDRESAAQVARQAVSSFIAEEKAKKQRREEAKARKESEGKAVPLSKDFVKKQRYAKDEKLNEKRQKLVITHGEELVKKAEANTQRLLDKGEVHIRVSSNSILKLIATDRFKSQFETGTGAAEVNTDLRKKLEENMFGYKSDMSAKDRPIYGYLARPEYAHKTDKQSESEFTGIYGDIVVRLKPSIKQRTTIAGDDTLDTDKWSTSTAEASFQPSRLNQISASSFLPANQIESKNSQDFARSQKKLQAMADAKDLNELSNAVSSQSGNRRTGYLEVQMHGQVTPSDIAEITYTAGSKPSPFILDWAKKNGVSISQK